MLLSGNSHSPIFEELETIGLSQFCQLRLASTKAVVVIMFCDLIRKRRWTINFSSKLANDISGNNGDSNRF
jgi:hypothetical protein